MGKVQFSALDNPPNQSPPSPIAAAKTDHVDLVLVGGDLLFRSGLRRLFENTPIAIIGEADTTDNLVALDSAAVCPDVLLVVDPDMPETGSDAWTRPCKTIWPDVHSVALIAGHNAQAAVAALHNGLDGCFFTDMSPRALVHAIQLVALGENIFPTRVGQNFFQRNSHTTKPNLTPREQDILQGLLAGHSNKMIANNLGTTDMTVKAQLRHLLRKLDVANRTQAALWARENGIDREDAVAAERQAH